MFSNVRNVRYIEEDKYIFLESVGDGVRVPNVGEQITDIDYDRDYEELYYEVVEVRMVIDRTAGAINYDVYLKQV